MSYNSRFVQLAVTGIVVLALGACTTLSVTTDSNPNVSVASCHTYTWAQEHIANLNEASAFGNPLNADRLRVAIESNLAARGIAKAADRTPPDCVVGYSIGSRLVADYYAGWGVGFGYGWHRGWGYGGWGRAERRRYDGPGRSGQDRSGGGRDLHEIPGGRARGRTGKVLSHCFCQMGACKMPALLSLWEHGNSDQHPRCSRECSRRTSRPCGVAG